MEDFKDKYLGKIGYILGTGKSLESFVIDNSDHIYFGMNTCYLYPHIAPHLNVLISEYYYEDIIIKTFNNKFTHHHMLSPNKQLLWGKSPLKSLIDPTIPIFYDDRIDHCVQALQHDKYTNKHPHDFTFLKNVIGYAPGITKLNGQSSTAYLTTLFAAYTGCSEIRIIGCDCDGTLTRLLKGWKGVKKILNEKYPNLICNNKKLFGK